MSQALADRSPFLVWLFTRYLLWWVLPRGLRALRVSRGGRPRAPEGAPVIVYANHPSWWDPLLFIVLMHRFFPGRRGFGPMDRQQLGRYGFMRRLGIFGIDPASRRGAQVFLREGELLLSNSNHVLWVTATGTFADARVRPLGLRSGIAHLAERVPGAVLLPLAIELVHWSERQPEALVRFGEPIQAADLPARPHEATAVLEAALTETMDELARDSLIRDPALFETLLSGSAGVGGIYDLFRRLSAWSGGRRFEPAHRPDDGRPPRIGQRPGGA